MSNDIYNSSTRGPMPASGQTKALMYALRIATHDHHKQDSVASATALSEARAELVKYITTIEDDLSTHRVQHAEQKRREYARSEYRKFIDRYSSHSPMRSYFAQGNHQSRLDRVFSTDTARKLFAVDWIKIEARVLARKMKAQNDPFYRLFTQLGRVS